MEWLPDQCRSMENLLDNIYLLFHNLYTSKKMFVHSHILVVLNYGLFDFVRPCAGLILSHPVQVWFCHTLSMLDFVTPCPGWILSQPRCPGWILSHPVQVEFCHTLSSLDVLTLFCQKPNLLLYCSIFYPVHDIWSRNCGVWGFPKDRRTCLDFRQTI